MHEYSLILSLIERVEQEIKTHGATCAHRIKISVGELSGVEADLLQSAYEIARESTPSLSHAELVVSRVAALWQCRECHREVSSQESLLCTACKSPAELVKGGEILLESVELEVPTE